MIDNEQIDALTMAVCQLLVKRGPARSEYARALAAKNAIAHLHKYPEHATAVCASLMDQCTDSGDSIFAPRAIDTFSEQVDIILG